MAKELKIIKYLNYYLLAGMTDIRFAGKKAYGLTELRERDKDLIIPAEILQSGELRYVGIDDTYPVIMYHRSYGSTISQDKASIFNVGFTDTIGNHGNKGIQDLVEKSEMSLFVFAQWKKVRMSISEFKDFIVGVIPGEIDKVSCSNIGIKSAFMILSSSNFNTIEIYSKEYKNNKKLNPDFFLMEIKYSIECRFNKSCVKTSNCIAPPSEEYLLTEIGENILTEAGENILIE